MLKRKQRGSLTVEASLALPIFVFAALSVIYISQLILYGEKVQWAMTRVAREVSAEYAAWQKDMMVNPAYLTGKLRMYLDDDKPIVSLLRSRFDKNTDELTLVADYQLTVPFPVPAARRFVFTHQICTRAFTGVETRLDQEEAEDDSAIVYITKTGTVYHRELSCTYLKLSISRVKYGDLEHMRSENGAKYYACASCCRGRTFGGDEDVFICNYGDRFHSFQTCKNIKRSVQEIRLSEAGGRLPCSKCGKE